MSVSVTAFLLLLLLHLLGSVYSAVPLITDAVALLLIKNSLTNTTSLSSWSSGTDPCGTQTRWRGVICSNGVLTGLRLHNMGLGGTINVSALSHLKSLRSLSLSHNNLSGPIPHLASLDALKAIYLEDNHFSGTIPKGLFAQMDHLKKLYLSGNNFTGAIPSSLSNATALLELHLDRNRFSGSLAQLHLPALNSFNVSHNALKGAIPNSLLKFNASSFMGNPGLCGGKLHPCHGGDGRVGSTILKPVLKLSPPHGATPTPTPAQPQENAMEGVYLVLGLVGCVVMVGMAGMRRRDDGLKIVAVDKYNSKVEDWEMTVTDTKHGIDEKGSGSVLEKPLADSVGRETELVVVNETKGPIQLSDLTMAEAEVLGSGGLGSAYKAVLPGGFEVAVRMMMKMNRVGKETFDAQMRRLGRLNHPNVLSPLTYHYRKDEKLIIFEFIPKGSLLYVLHGDGGPNHAALNWPTRLKIIRGIAAGMAYLHAELNDFDIPHGNLKSGNVLLSESFDPLLIDYGYISLVNPSHASKTMLAYKSPESLNHRRVSPKSDVYCLGILILEILTGKFPSHYLNNTKGGTELAHYATSAILEGREAEILDRKIASEAGVAAKPLIRVGLACAEHDPEQRPDMKKVAVVVEEVVAAAVAQIS